MQGFVKAVHRNFPRGCPDIGLNIQNFKPADTIMFKELSETMSEELRRLWKQCLTKY